MSKVTQLGDSRVNINPGSLPSITPPHLLLSVKARKFPGPSKTEEESQLLLVRLMSKVIAFQEALRGHGDRQKGPGTDLHISGASHTAD